MKRRAPSRTIEEAPADEVETYRRLFIRILSRDKAWNHGYLLPDDRNDIEGVLNTFRSEHVAPPRRARRRARNNG